jgi:hypothetical protein
MLLQPTVVIVAKRFVEHSLVAVNCFGTKPLRHVKGSGFEIPIELGHRVSPGDWIQILILQRHCRVRCVVTSSGNALHGPATTQQLQVFLNESRAEMHIDLDQRLISDALEAVNLARFDDEDVAGAGLEFLSVDVPDAAAFANELNFIVRMAMWTGSTPGLSAQEKDRDIDIAVVGTDEVMRAPLERQVCLTGAMHLLRASGRVRVSNAS